MNTEASKPQCAMSVRDGNNLLQIANTRTMPGMCTRTCFGTTLTINFFSSATVRQKFIVNMKLRILKLASLGVEKMRRVGDGNDLLLAINQSAYMQLLRTKANVEEIEEKA